MLIPRTKITFTKESGEQYVFDFVTEWETEESVDNLTQTFKITFPRALQFEGRELFSGNSPVFERGDQILVEAGYYPELRQIFQGWVSEISAKIPVTIMCEDDMYLLKNTRVTYPDKSKLTYYYTSKKKGKALKRPKVISPQVKLGELLDAILPDDIEYDAVDKNLNLGMYRATNVSVSEILDHLKSHYGLSSRFRQEDRKLYVGFRSNAADTQTQYFEFENNIISDENLEYRRAEDMSIKVVVKSIDINNVTTEVEVGDTDGSQRTYHLYNSDKAAMTEYANKKLTEVKYTGYSGSFETFGEPYIRPGDIANLVSKKLPERDGNYLVTSVRRTLGMGGYRQEPEIGAKV